MTSLGERGIPSSTAPCPPTKRCAKYMMATGSAAGSPRPLSSSRNAKEKNGGKEMVEIKARPYQLELLDASLNDNTIVNLGTGAGKTFIAVMLIRELSHQILDPFEGEGAQRTVFLVNTVPLVKQQSEYVRNHTHLEVGQYIGDMGVDSWSRPKWLQEFDEHHVLVMTRAIFKDLLIRGFVHLRKVNLIIFDECHHAVKNDDYVQIMKVFDSCREDETPRILGLTASLIPSKCKPGDLEKKILRLEETLRCRSQTAKDMDEVARYATNPEEKVLHYTSSGVDRELKEILEGPLNFLKSFKKEQKSSTRYYEYVKSYLDDSLHILENLGVWCAHGFAQDALKEIEGVVAEAEHVESRWERSLLCLGRTHLKIFVEKADKRLKSNDRVKVTLTPKVQSLLRHLGDSGISTGEVMIEPRPTVDRTHARRKSVAHLLGIIFVQRRTTAEFLAKLLKHKSREDSDLRYIKCEYIVGPMSVKKQNEILEKFRKEKINLLVSTSVVEEGVDVPKCNLVVRFDFPPTLQSYIQSKGRARAKESTFLILIERENEAQICSQLRDYRLLEEELKCLCHNREIPGEEAILKRMEEIVPPYTPFGIMAGTRATLSSSLPLVHRYCQKLPSDRYTILTPIFKTEKRRAPESYPDPFSAAIPSLPAPGEFEYCSTLTLPMSSPVRTEIKGMWMPTRRIADKSAALEGVKQLHKAGELDHHLLPISKNMDSDEEDVAKMEEKKRLNAGTEKRAHDYPNEVAPSLTDCFPTAGPGNLLYIFVVHEAESGRIYMSLPGEASHTALGILTRKPLPHLKIPEFSLYDGEKEVYVKVHKYHSAVTSVSDTELEILKQCHKIIFTEMLKVRATWLQPEFEHAAKNYLVVPLGVLPDLDPMEAHLDMDLAKRVADMGSQLEQPIEWPCPTDIFTNALVTGLYCPPADRKLYEVVCVDNDTTPRSRFPDPKRAASFAEYFKIRYNHNFRHLNQPALECKPVGMSASRLKLITSRFKTSEGEELKKNTQRSTIKLFPETCALYPLPANFWKLARCLPSILWRVECILLVDALRSTVARETGVSLSSEGFEVTTHTTLRGYEDYGFGELKTQCFSTTVRGDEEVHILKNPDLSKFPLRGPDNALLLQAMTPKRANDSINLERLETLGDSFLKFTTSAFLFCDRPHAHEGRLTSARSRRVGNLNLFFLAKQKERGVTGKILSTSFEPREMWIPPCFSFNESDPYLTQSSQQPTEHNTSAEVPKLPEQQRHYLYHRVSDKGVADCIEAILGSYLVSGGIEAGLKFMKWMGVKITKDDESKQFTANNTSLSPPSPKRLKPSLPQDIFNIAESTNTPLFIRDSSLILSKHFGPLPQTVYSERDQYEIQRLLTVSSSSRHELHAHKLEVAIKWTFHNPSLLLQALTHASYTKNRVTDCYQRLEFLGDAVLDYLITCNIYSTFPNYGPGEITGMRSALVNNITFAELAIKLELHKALLHNSPALFKQIPQYIEAFKKLSANNDMKEEKEEGEVESETVTESSEILCRDQDDSGTAAASLPEPEPPMVEDGDEEEVEEVDPPKVLGDLLESLAGAIFLDSGMNLETVWRVFRPLFQSKIEQFKGKIPVPPIQELFELEPNVVSKSSRKGGRARCTLTVVDRDIQVSAEASSHKAAKSAAARAALRKIKAQTC